MSKRKDNSKIYRILTDSQKKLNKNLLTSKAPQVKVTYVDLETGEVA